MWKATNPDGSLQYTFMESVSASYPYWQIRTFGGIIFVVGMLLFLYNIYMTMRRGTLDRPQTVKA